MGRVAHSSPAHRLDIIRASVAADNLDLVQRIRALLDASAQGAGFPRNEVEPTLTEGYAMALELDAKCLRLEQHIDRLTRAVAGGRDVSSGEFSVLLERLNDTEHQTEELRALLVRLRKLVAKAA